MFTGIIEAKAKILEIKNGRFKVENTFDAKQLKIGQSISHDGACMSLEEINTKSYYFFAMEETLKKTNFKEKKQGDFFNVERCLKIGDRLDGHMVSGHIDNIGKIIEIIKTPDSTKIIKIKFDKKYKNLIIEKGSISLNGVSLTVIQAKENIFSVSIIPLTEKITNLLEVKLGDSINIEFDMIGKYINRINNK